MRFWIVGLIVGAMMTLGGDAEARKRRRGRGLFRGRAVTVNVGNGRIYRWYGSPRTKAAAHAAAARYYGYRLRRNTTPVQEDGAATPTALRFHAFPAVLATGGLLMLDEKQKVEPSQKPTQKQPSQKSEQKDAAQKPVQKSPTAKGKSRRQLRRQARAERRAARQESRANRRT